MERLLSITSSPHLRSKSVTQTIMRDVLIALAPTLVAAVVIFGTRALAVVAVCVGTCVISEYLYRKLMHLSNTVPDLSAAVTGLILAFNLPVAIPLWMAAIGSFAAVVIVKQLFGGIGKNFANPAIVGRIVLFISFATPMTTWVLPKSAQAAAISSATATLAPGLDAVTGATPLATGGAGFNYLQMFLGNTGGCIGETCTLTILLGLIYMVARKVITISAPVAFLGSLFLFAAIAPGQDPVFHLLAGGAMFGAVFMATDYVTTPTTEMGKVIFGVGCGIITMCIRLFASYPEGVSFAILLMNIVTPHIDRLCKSKPFGEVKAA